MTDASAPPPGFYDAPDMPGKQRWWDGSQWTDITQDAHSSGDDDHSHDSDQPRSTVDKLVGSLADKVPDAQTAIGGALIADGVIGFGRNRVGIGGAIGNLVFGIGFMVVFGLFVAPWMSSQTAITDPVTTQAEVVAIEQFQSDNTDDKGNVTSTSLVCTVTIEYPTQSDGVIQATTPFSSSSLCTRFVGEQIEIRYDAQSPGRFEGLDTMSDGFTKWFPWIFVAVGALMAISGLWTLLLRATQIGGGIYLIARSRQKDHDKVVAKQAKKAANRSK